MERTVLVDMTRRAPGRSGERKRKSARGEQATTGRRKERGGPEEELDNITGRGTTTKTVEERRESC